MTLQEAVERAALHRNAVLRSEIRGKTVTVLGDSLISRPAVDVGDFQATDWRVHDGR